METLLHTEMGLFKGPENFLHEKKITRKVSKIYLKFIFASFANTGAHETSILSDDSIRTLQCHYFPSVGPAGLNPFSHQQCSMTVVFRYLLLSLHISLYVHVDKYITLLCLRPIFLFLTEHPCQVHVFTYWLIIRLHQRAIFLILNNKRGADVTSVCQLIFPRSPCFLFTARLGCSQDSQETHIATNCCAACKHWPGLTCVYSTTLLGHRCVPHVGRLSRYQHW